MRFRRFVIIGPGLIGGSVGMAVKAAGLADKVVGVGHRQVSLDQALTMDAIDEGGMDVGEAADDADFVLLCTRIGLFAEVARQVAPRMMPGGVLSDVGSTKSEVVAKIEEAIDDAPVAFVGGHPLAGSEQRGITAARADLFRRSICILTPGAKSTAAAQRTVAALWSALGATVHTMTPEVHDAILAEISHLPHMVAAALVQAVSDGSLSFAGSGFRDTTRIASGDPTLWRDICATNRGALDGGLARLEETLRRVRQMIAHHDDEALEAFLREAKARRDRST